MTIKTGIIRAKEIRSFHLLPVPGADTSDTANHHHDHVRRAAHISLNDPFVDDLGEGGLTAYVAAVAAAARSAATGTSAESIVHSLRDAFDVAGIEIFGTELDVLAEELVNARGVVHISAYGDVVYGSHRMDVATFRPDVVGTEDPQSPYRPIFS